MKIIVPLHVSGIWIPYYSSNPLETGSIGAGINLSIYAESRVTRGLCKITINNIKVFPNSAIELCNELGVDISSNINSPFNLGSGFGLSAAVFITHSLGSYLAAGKPSIQALQRAHVFEVVNLTGLGDVIAEYQGGLAIRVKPGAPGIGYAYRVIPRERVNLIVAELGSHEDTSSVLRRMPNTLLEQGKASLRRIIETEDLKTYFDLSRDFTSKLFDYSIVNSLLNNVRGIIGYYMKKSALIVWAEKEFIDDISKVLINNNIKPYFASISQTGVVVDYTP